MLAALAGLESAAPAALLSALRDDMRTFTGNAEQSDDVTLLCVRWNGPLSGR
jgi:serine phosphatase RsbU (regulator of sigma subunit)